MRGELVMEAAQSVQMRVLGNVALHDARLNAVIGEFPVAEMTAEYATLVTYQLGLDQPRARNPQFRT